jgi:hypothetical protein
MEKLDYQSFLILLKKTENGQRPFLFNQNLEFLEKFFFDEGQTPENRIDAAGVIFRRKIVLNKELLEKFLLNKDWNIRRWSLLFLFKQHGIKKNLLKKDKDWRCVVFGEFIEKLPA